MRTCRETSRTFLRVSPLDSASYPGHIQPVGTAPPSASFVTSPGHIHRPSSPKEGTSPKVMRYISVRVLTPTDTLPLICTNGQLPFGADLSREAVDLWEQALARVILTERKPLSLPKKYARISGRRDVAPDRARIRSLIPPEGAGAAPGGPSRPRPVTVCPLMTNGDQWRCTRHEETRRPVLALGWGPSCAPP